MDQQVRKWSARRRRHMRVRRKVRGTPQRPRLSVYRSLTHMYSQLIDDLEGRTFVAVSTLQKKLREKVGYGGNVKAATAVGEELARRAREKGIRELVFDRGAYRYHGRVKALAEAARAGGLKF